jgi:integrase
MASISRDAKGNRTIQFVAADGKRRSVRLGKTTQRIAEAVKCKVEALLAAASANFSIDRETAEWLGELDCIWYGKLAAVGLVPERTELLLKPFLEEYAAERSDLKPSTRTNHRQAIKNLVDCFAPDKPVRSFSSDALDGERFRRFLLEQGLGENTVRKRSQIAKLFFKHAKRRKLVAENPFADLVGSVRSDRSKFEFVTIRDAMRILEACPDNEWRLIFALSRFGGLRCPSEHLALRWADVDWAGSRIRVRSPKTEHHAGHEHRMVPIFPELRPYLEAAWDDAAEGAEFVVTRSRNGGVNWRTQLLRIMDRAGVRPWPRLFHNLRATRQTELTNDFPQHVVCQWLGNSQAVAQEHYLRVTDEHFETASRPTAVAVQKAVQQPAELGRTKPQPNGQTLEIAGHCEGLPSLAMEIVLPDGLEPSTL